MRGPIAWAIVASVGLCACATSGASRSTSDERRVDIQQGLGPREMCPLMPAGTDVTVEQTRRGVALVFTTPLAYEVEEVRARVQSMAFMHEQQVGHDHEREALLRRGAHDERDMGDPLGAMPPSVASVVQVPNGARLELRADDPADVEALRVHATLRAEQMRIGRSCPVALDEAPV